MTHLAMMDDDRKHFLLEDCSFVHFVSHHSDVPEAAICILIKLRD